MNKEELESLLWRYENELCTDEERQKVEEWYEALQAGETSSLSGHDLDTVGHSIRASLNINPGTNKKESSGSPVMYRISVSAIAAAACLAIVFYLFYPFDDSEHPSIAADEIPLTLFTNNTDRDSILALSDGSTVTLLPGASLRYPSTFILGKREVFLNGDGFFSVYRDSTSPFYVYSNQLLIKVLGTSFFVRSRKTTASVAVHTGRVAVFKNQPGMAAENIPADKTPLVLTPNQQAIYQFGSDTLLAALVDDPRQITAKAVQPFAPLKFENSPLSNVLLTLSEVYGITITAFDQPVLKCRFTGDISDASLSLYDKLQMLCQAIDATYEIEGVEILIKGKGCY